MVNKTIVGVVAAAAILAACGSVPTRDEERARSDAAQARERAEARQRAVVTQAQQAAAQALQVAQQAQEEARRAAAQVRQAAAQAPAVPAPQAVAPAPAVPEAAKPAAEKPKEKERVLLNPFFSSVVMKAGGLSQEELAKALEKGDKTKFASDPKFVLAAYKKVMQRALGFSSADGFKDEDVVKTIRGAEEVACEWKKSEVHIAGFDKKALSKVWWWARAPYAGEKCLAHDGVPFLSLKCGNAADDKRPKKVAAVVPAPAPAPVSQPAGQGSDAQAPAKPAAKPAADPAAGTTQTDAAAQAGQQPAVKPAAPAPLPKAPAKGAEANKGTDVPADAKK